MSIPHRTIYRARRGGRLVPLAKSITPALRAFPPRKINYARSAGVPSSQNQLRPLCGRSLHLHLWRGGGRQAGGEVKRVRGEVKRVGGEVKRAGGEVKRAGDEVKIYKNEKRPKLNSFDHFLKKTREK